MTTLERADPSFAPRAPAERRAGNPRALLAGLPRQHDVPDPAVLRRAFIRARGEAAVGDGELRGAGPRGPARRAAAAAPRTALAACPRGAPLAHGVRRPDQRAQAPSPAPALPVPRPERDAALGGARGHRQ